MGDDDAGNSVVKVSGFGYEREIGVAAVIKITHMHATIKHNPLPIDGDHHATLPNLLPCAYTHRKQHR